MRELVPGIAAVGRLEQATARPAADQAPGASSRLPERGVQHARVVRVQAQVVRAGVLAPEQDVLPGLPAVFGAVDAALSVRTVGMAEGGDVHQVRVSGMNADPRDVARVGQADVRPGLAAIGRAVDTIAVRHVAADAALAHARVQHVRIGRGQGERAYRGTLKEAVGDVLPVHAAVGGFPHATAGRTEVEDARIRRVTRDCSDAPSTERANQAILQRFECLDAHRAKGICLSA